MVIKTKWKVLDKYKVNVVFITTNIYYSTWSLFWEIAASNEYETSSQLTQLLLTWFACHMLSATSSNCSRLDVVKHWSLFEIHSIGSNQEAWALVCCWSRCWSSQKLVPSRSEMSLLILNHGMIRNLNKKCIPNSKLLLRPNIFRITRCIFGPIFKPLPS